jgi:hypothetical protein
MAKPAKPTADKTSKPGKADKADKPARVKKSKPEFPGLEDGKLKVAVPSGWEWGKFKPLKRSAFEAEYLHLEHKAAELQAKAQTLLEKAEESKKMGAGKERGKAKRLIKLQERMAELRETLEKEGVDVNALLASVKKSEEETEDEA